MRRILLSIALLTSCFLAGAQTISYDADFEYFFLNNEYDRSEEAFVESGTINAARLTPYIDYSFRERRGTDFKLRLGVDIMKEMGDGLGCRDVFREMLLYFESRSRAGRGTFSTVAGIFPRSFSEGRYSMAFFSDEERFLNSNFEGFFLKYRRDGLYAEFGMDWRGKYGYDRREQFQLLSSGSVDLMGDLAFGWAASMYHYAGSQLVWGVVDNSMLNPYLVYDPSAKTRFRKLEFTLGGIFTYQWDRRFDSEKHFPMGLEAAQNVKIGAFGIDNTFYFGQNLFYYFGKYGADLYHGDTFYNIQVPGCSWYDGLSIYFEPRISSFISLNVALDFNFGESFRGIPVYRGMEQMISLKFDLEKFRRR